MRIVIAITLLCSACGIDLLRAVEPLDDGSAPYLCTGHYFGRIESELPIDCDVVRFNETAAIHAVLQVTQVSPESYIREMRRSTVHIRAAMDFKSADGADVNGESWVLHIDLGRGMGTWAHESLHVYDMAHWHLDTFMHPNWGSFCPVNRSDGLWSCDYSMAESVYEMAYQPIK